MKRFGTYYYVAGRFLKSASRLYYLIDLKDGNACKTAYAKLKMKMTANVDRIITVYSGIEAVFDAFRIIVDCVYLL